MDAAVSLLDEIVAETPTAETARESESLMIVAVAFRYAPLARVARTIIEHPELHDRISLGSDKTHLEKAKA